MDSAFPIECGQIKYQVCPKYEPEALADMAPQHQPNRQILAYNTLDQGLLCIDELPNTDETRVTNVETAQDPLNRMMIKPKRL